jgi:L-ascorbate metabolism protein UlaG (beta-lactamase superfamily)
MKRILLLPLLIITCHSLTHAGSFHPSNIFKSMEQRKNAEEIIRFAHTIEWLGQATTRILYNGMVIYIDPYQLKETDKAGLILITHDHNDHLSLPDIAKIAGTETPIVVAAAGREKLEQAGYKNNQTVSPGSEITVMDLMISAVPAYNITKPMHPKNKGYVGYVIDFGGIRVYHTGDTERVPEMKAIRCDIILVPLGQKYTMNSVEDAVEAVLDTGASVAIPIHYRLYEGSTEDARKFSELLKVKGVTVLNGK